MQKIRPDTQIQQIGASLNQGLLWNGTGWVPANVSLPGHTHVESDVTALVGDLAAKVAKAIFTAKGSIITATGSAAPVELSVGTDGQVLTARSTAPNGVDWETPTGGGGGMTDPTTTKGDLIVRSATAPTRLPVGTNGQVLVSRSTATNGVDWETPAVSTTSRLHSDLGGTNFTSTAVSTWTSVTGLAFTYTPTVAERVVIMARFRLSINATGNVYTRLTCTPAIAVEGSPSSSFEGAGATNLHTFNLVGVYDLAAGTAYTFQVQIFFGGTGVTSCTLSGTLDDTSLDGLAVPQSVTGGGGGASTGSRISAVPSSSFSSSTLSTWTDITGMSASYTPTNNERLIISTRFRYFLSVAANVYFRVSVTPAPAAGPQFIDFSAENQQGGSKRQSAIFSGVCDLAAATAYTIKAQFFLGTGTITVDNTVEDTELSAVTMPR